MIVYLIRNTVDGKCYVGQTVRDFERRIVEHRSAAKKGKGRLYNAIRKYGWENFESEVLEECVDAADLDMSERFWIRAYNSLSPNGYNLKGGGHDNHTLSREVRDKIRAKKMEPEAQAHIRRIGKANAGRKRLDAVAKFSKTVSVYNQNGDWLSAYDSARIASKHTGVHHGTISDCVRGRIKSGRNKEGVVYQFRLGDSKENIGQITYKGRGNEHNL